MGEKLLIFQKAYDLIIWIYPVVNRIPKGHRIVLGREMENISLSILMSAMRANKARGKERRDLQMRISEDLDLIRILLRLTKDLRFMSVKQYTMGAEKINELGRMVSSWMKVTQ